MKWQQHFYGQWWEGCQRPFHLSSLQGTAGSQLVPFVLPLLSLPFLSSSPALKEQTSQVENHDGGDRRGGLDTGIQGNGFQISKSVLCGRKGSQSDCQNGPTWSSLSQAPPASLCALPLPTLLLICLLLHVPSTSYHPILTPVGFQETSGDVSVEPLKQQCFFLLLQGLTATSNFWHLQRLTLNS